MTNTDGKVGYWHRELPPIEAEIAGEGMFEATSRRVPGTIAHRDDLWHACYEDLMTQAELRLAQEVHRMGGDYAHVFDEAVEIRRDEIKGEAWLRGRFSFVLYRRSPSVSAGDGSHRIGVGAQATTS